MKPENKTKKDSTLDSSSRESVKKTDTLDGSPEESFQKIKEKTDDLLKGSYDYAVNISHKVDKNIKEGIQKTKESSFVKDMQSKAEHLKTMDEKEKNMYKRKFFRTLTKIRNVIFEIFEKFVGRIRIGTQYGKSSIDLLSELAKLKELGIITEKEFESKKKEILDRI